MSNTSVMLHGIDRDALLRVVAPIVHAHGAEVVDAEFRPERGGWVLRLYVEKQGSAEGLWSTRDAAVDLELCAGVSRDLSPALDVAELIPHPYHLEVSSPGVERPLRSEKDFVRFTGERAKIKLRDSLAAGQRVLIGVLDGVVEGEVRVREGKRVHGLPLHQIESARLVFEFGVNTSQSRHKARVRRDVRDDATAVPRAARRGGVGKRH
ncbi:MAG: ribosome maturation factor RimP [Polyangiaceae bacterium]|jgi:ribosome maturation factor RimP